VHSDSSVPEHSLWTRGRHYDHFIYADGVISVHENIHIRICQTRILYGVRERRDDTKLELFFGVIARHAQKCSLLKLFLVDLNNSLLRSIPGSTMEAPTSRFESVVLRRTHQLTRRFARYMIPSSCRRQKVSTTAFESC